MSLIRLKTRVSLLKPRLAGCLFLFLSAASTAGADDAPEWLPGLLQRDQLTVVVTDSGLGGLSVVADAAEKLRAHRGFRAVDLIFVNALFTNEGGYNSLTARAEKLAVLDSAMNAMQKRFAPDVLLVACNTLSVLVPDTPFDQAGTVPLVGIVELGVEQIAEQLKSNPDGMNILLGTQTTVDEGTHASLLEERGFGSDRLLPQACPQLTLHIEEGFDSMYTEMLIDAYVDDALSRLGEPQGPLSVSFNCTHFGYSLDLWRKAFDSRGVEVVRYLDPNTHMIDFLLPDASRNRYPETTVTVRVVSMIDIPENRLESIGRYLQTVSPAAGQALRDYERIPDLFEWRSLAPSALPEGG